MEALGGGKRFYFVHVEGCVYDGCVPLLLVQAAAAAAACAAAAATAGGIYKSSVCIVID